jgi:5-methylcytosine-specific restriction endonuclease McrA
LADLVHRRGLEPASEALVPWAFRRQPRRDHVKRRGTGRERAHQQRAKAAIAAQPWCSECGSTRDLTADHLIPLARGGHPLGPLRVLYRSCNSRRGAAN